MLLTGLFLTIDFKHRITALGAFGFSTRHFSMLLIETPNKLDASRFDKPASS
tara:strand:- start:475 stop:630 length:156 start_codon:yes stop_codon:yes gene_type:complete